MRKHEEVCPTPEIDLTALRATCPSCIAIRRARHAAYRHALGLIEKGCPDCGESCLVFTDCCEEPRWECETGLVFDSAGDPDVRLCRAGTGCDADNPWFR